MSKIMFDSSCPACIGDAMLHDPLCRAVADGKRQAALRAERIELENAVLDASKHLFDLSESNFANEDIATVAAKKEWIEAVAALKRFEAKL